MIEIHRYVGKEVTAVFETDRFVHIIRGKYEGMQGESAIFSNAHYIICGNASQEEYIIGDTFDKIERKASGLVAICEES